MSSMVECWVLFVLLAATAVAAGNCPAEFLRLSDHHSYCQPPNPQCQLLAQGVTEKEKRVILDTHNQLRNKLALGKDNSNGLPTASDMTEMVWDDTLAAIAQQYAYQCTFDHDCGPCRSTADYSVGQNLGQGSASCDSDNCAGASDAPKKRGEWKEIIEMFYNERKFVSKRLINSYVFGKKYGHFSALAWSKTWRVGCGYTAYLNGPQFMYRLFVCNYGPSGNSDNVPIYQSGKACSACPTPSTCGSGTYPGLCKLDNPNREPAWKGAKDNKKIIYDCKFDQESNCQYNVQGSDQWRLYPRVYGASALVVLQPGQSTTMNFLQTIKPKSNFCLVFVVRKGPNVAGEQEAGDLKGNIQMGDYDPWIVDVGMSWPDFTPTSLTCFQKDTTFSLTYTIPDNVPAQYLEIKRVYAYEGDCSN